MPRRSPRCQASQAAVVFGVTLAVLVSALCLCVGAEFGRQTPHEKAAYAISLAAFNHSQNSPTALAAGLNADCYTYTGGTCGVDPCYAWRSASCEQGKCLCLAGCTGADGKCYPGTYKEVAAGFTLTNVKFHSQKLYMPAVDLLDQLKTTAVPSFLNGGKDKFVLHALPGSLAGHKDYFLTTMSYPGYVAAIRATAGTAVSLFGAYEVSLDKEFSPDRLAVRVCNKGGGQVMIGSPGSVNTEWFFVHHGSWDVYGWGLTNDPGQGGYWQPDPPIPVEELEACP